MKQMHCCAGPASSERSVVLSVRCRTRGISVDATIKGTFLNTAQGVCPYAVGQNVTDNLEEQSATPASAEREKYFFLVNDKIY